eukprot:scaffold1790_cov257-Pinguiococcus_pyrenoidosus.AAC.53
MLYADAALAAFRERPSVPQASVQHLRGGPASLRAVLWQRRGHAGARGQAGGAPVRRGGSQPGLSAGHRPSRAVRRVPPRGEMTSVGAKCTSCLAAVGDPCFGLDFFFFFLLSDDCGRLMRVDAMAVGVGAPARDCQQAFRCVERAGDLQDSPASQDGGHDRAVPDPHRGGLQGAHGARTDSGGEEGQDWALPVA